MKFLRGLFVSSLVLLSSVEGHRPLINGISCGKQFHNKKNAVVVPDIEVEWSANRIVTCDAPAFWIKFDINEAMVNRPLYVSAGSLHPRNDPSRSPELSRFEDYRISSVLLGPGLPSLDRSKIPDHIKIPKEFTTGLIMDAPLDQTTCDHSEWLTAMDADIEVVDGVCTFYEFFGKTYQTVQIDKTPTAPEVGEYYVTSYFQENKPGKMWVAVGVVGGKEDFVTQYKIPTGTCDCGDNLDLIDFYEKTAVTRSVPKVEFCTAENSGDVKDYCESDRAVQPVCKDEPENFSAGAKMMGLFGCSKENCKGMMASMAAPNCKRTCELCVPSESELKAEARELSLARMAGMEMGCGDTSCASSKAFLDENAIMHANMGIEFECDAEADFVRGMIAHHVGAVAMCAVLLEAQDFTDAGLVHFCDHVRSEQSLEVDKMTAWLNDRQLDAGTPCEGSEMGCGELSCETSQQYLELNHIMHAGMSIEFTCNTEVDFVQGMIPHHDSAIGMCAIVVDATTADPDPFLVDLCVNITKVQKAEVMWMTKWLEEQNVPLGAACDANVNFETPCYDVLLITEFCHTVGGDGNCECPALVEEYGCSDNVMVKGYEINMLDVCSETCGVCPDDAPDGMIMTFTGDHSMDHSMDHSGGDVDHSSHSGRMDMGSANPVAPCNFGEVSVYMVGQAAIQYGATSNNQCVQTCMMEFVLQWMPTATKGECSKATAMGTLIETKSVTPAGSPMPMTVNVFASAASASPVTVAPAVVAPAVSLPPCNAGELIVHMVGQEAVQYGADHEDQCIQTCMMEFVLTWIPAAVKGECSTGAKMAQYVETKTVTPVGSPMPMTVHVFQAASASGGEEKKGKGGRKGKGEKKGGKGKGGKKGGGKGKRKGNKEDGAN